jgi:hypothetical protein
LSRPADAETTSARASTPHQSPPGAYGDGHRNICLDPPLPGHLILDVVHDNIAKIAST